ncbi:HTH-type transcriptional regulator GltC [Achromobacter anxifer]|uniref:LysR family transcriptional regulator n=1 Tax=Achromobacter anxifer TaxID=1287737 RepID=UPI00155CA524|nr:LysR family transcriptional regulator [Achromobacter anxifer]CAB5512424.1 HTH-type transcriptional regulator GltC [Achromobacter anxifer]
MENSAEAVSLRQLRALVSVADTASFTIAADQLGLSQPSISHLIRRLENEVGQALVIRGREVSLTAQGRALADMARRSIMTIDSALKECRDQSQLRTGSVSVAVGHVSAATLLPQILHAFHAQHPALEMQVVDCMVEQIKNKLVSHEADLGIGAMVEGGDTQIMLENLIDGSVHLFMRDDHPLAARKQVDAKVLAELRCIQLNPQAPAWLAISRQLAAEEIFPRIEQRVILLSTAFGMVQAGMGVAMLPSFASAQMPPGIKAVPLRNPVLDWPVSLARLANRPLSPAAQAFAAVARTVLRRQFARA